MFKSFLLELNISAVKTNYIFSVNSNDLNTIRLDLVIKDNAASVDLTGKIVRLAIRKPDNTVVFQPGGVTDGPGGKCEFILSKQASLVAGRHEGEVMIYEGDSTVAVTTKFYYEVKRAVLSNSDLESSSDFPAISQAIAAGEILKNIDITSVIEAGAIAGAAQTEMNLAKQNEDGTQFGTVQERLNDSDFKIKSNTEQLGNVVGKFDFETLPTDGFFLGYDVATSKWKPKPPPKGGGGIYLVDPEDWGMKTDGTDAVNTTLGINNMLVWAETNGYAEVLFPRNGLFLIDENNPVTPRSYMTINLNGSTLKIRPNGLPNYAVITFKNNQIFARITNGKLEGDRYTHDYSSGGAHEGGYGISFGVFVTGAENNARFVSVDNMDIFNFTGDSITLNSTFNQITPGPTTFASSLESGGISTTDGTLTVDATKIRSNLNISMKHAQIVKNGYFGLYGNGYGTVGPGITAGYYNVYFYRLDNSFISAKIDVQFFDEVEVPTDAEYAKVVIHQAIVPPAADVLINLRVPTFPKNVYIEKCNLHHNRRQGISVCGAKNIYITQNHIHHIGGVDPQSGIDIEDGYDLNQMIYIENNVFQDNEKYNIIVVNGKHIVINNNILLPTNSTGYIGLTINGGTDRVLVTNNIIKQTKVALSGDTTFANNYVYGTQVNVTPAFITRPVNVTDNIFYNCKVVVDSQHPFAATIDNCRFINDLNKVNIATNQWTLELKNEPQTISNCLIEGQDLLYVHSSAASNLKPGWIFTNLKYRNVKTFTLFPGKYTNLEVLDLGIGGLTIAGSVGNVGTVELINCKFVSTDANNTLLAPNNLKSFIMRGCTIEKQSGKVLSVLAVSNEVILKGNNIKVTADALPRTIATVEASFTGSNVIIEDNYIAATNSNQIGIDNLTTNSPLVVIRNNTMKKATIKQNGKEIILNNILDGVIDPYFNGTAAPTTTPNYIGQTFLDTTNKKLYKAFGTTSSADWIIMN